MLAFGAVEYLKRTLPNGVRILVSEMPETRSASLAVFVGAGSRMESRKDAGTSHFLEHMVFKGTAKRPTAAPRPAPPAISASPTTREAELRMLYLMNASRMLAGLVPLALDTGVSDAARTHSSVEAQYRYVYHDGPDGTARSRYVSACGTGWYGENTGKVWSGGVEVLHREFMAEPWEPINHRTNIMDPNFRRVGIGAVEGPDAVYITMAFCR
jgi:uncharacterized protein YkwD